MARRFNGTTQGLTLGDTDITGPWTITALIAPEAQIDGKVFQQGDRQEGSINGEFGLMIRTWGLQAFVFIGGAQVSCELMIGSPDSFDYQHDGGTWHIMATWDGTSLRLYVDGVLVKTSSAAGAMNDTGAPYANATAAYTNEFGGIFYFDGTLCELAVDDTAWSDGQAAQLAAWMRPDQVGTPKHYWRVLGQADPEPDGAGALAATLVAAPPGAQHPKMQGEIGFTGRPVKLTTSGSEDSIEVTIPDVPAGGGILVYGLSFGQNCSIADDRSGVYVPTADTPLTDGNNGRHHAWVANAVTGGTTVVTLTPAAGTYLTLWAIPFAGQAVVDVVIDAAANASASAPLTSDSVTTDGPALIVAMIGNVGLGEGYAAEEGWVELTQDRSGAGFQGYQVIARLEGAGGTFSNAWTQDTFVAYGALIVALRQAAETEPGSATGGVFSSAIFRSRAFGKVAA